MFNPHSNDWLLNKFEIYKELRELPTAYWSNIYGMYIITRYDDVIFALNNPDIFSSSKGNLIVESHFRFNRTLGASDNPLHNTFKSIVKNAYTKDNIDRIVATFKNQARNVLFKGKLNISSIIENLSAWVATEVLNLPYDKEAVKDIVLDIQKTAPQAVKNSKTRAAHDDLTNLVTMLLNNNVPPSGPGIYKEYVAAGNPNVMSLFTGPTISGASSLTGALEFLTIDLYKENQLKYLLNDSSLIPNAINESLRFHASTGRFSRTVTKEVILHNTVLRPGDRVALCLESANRDPRVFTDPDKFLLTRDTKKHLAFGHGVHACIALAISKACMQEYLSLLLNLVGNYKVITIPKDYKYTMTASGNDDMIENLIIEAI